MGICALLLVTGLLNFINLYMIFMLKRTHEYGIRRVFGAGRGAVFAQICRELSAFRFGCAACVGMH
mgnify:CR=1 FL=1